MNIPLKNTLSLIRFIRFVFKGFVEKKCFDTANALSYTTLLSVVPFFALMFAGFSSFPVFKDIMYELEVFIFSNFIPASSDIIREHLMSFVGQTSKLTIIGLFSLLLIALLLMWKIDQSLNNIWSSSKKRDYIKTLLTYWAVLTLGPVLIGLSLMATSYLTSLPIITDTAEIIGLKIYLLQFVALFFTLTAFTLTYLIVPNTRVNIKHALIGGLLATLLFELSKQGFAWYVSKNDTYQNIYGALSTIPIFLIWIYISWVIILLGAMIARSLTLFDFYDNFPDEYHYDIHQGKFISALTILQYLWESAKQGKALKEHAFDNSHYILPGNRLQEVLNQLEKSKWIHQTERNEWALSRELDEVSLYDFYQSLPFCLPRKTQLQSMGQLADNISQLIENELDVPIKDILKIPHQPG